MNLKSILALTTLAAVGTVSAAVTSANTLCRIEVNSGAKSTIIGIPLTKISATQNQDIPVTSLVLTDNLEVGDTIQHWNGSKWDAWVIADVDGVKTWQPTIIAEGNNVSTSAPAANTALARGDAIWVNRNSNSADLTKPFYVYGQVGWKGPGSVITIPAGTADAPVYTLVGNPLLQSFPLSAIQPSYGTGDSTIAVGDKVVFVNSQNDFGYNEYTWQTVSGTETQAWCVKGRYTENGTRRIGWVAVDESVVIGPGEGCWYISVGGSPKIAWQD